MTTPSPSEERPAEETQTELMPRWVPVAIGVVLVTLAALAVLTGLRYRDDTLVDIVESRRIQQTAAAPPGEPEAGASRIMSGVPAANAAVNGESLQARRGMIVKGAREGSVVYINDVPVGQAREFDSHDEAYDFAATGSYTVRVIAPSGEEKLFVVTVSEGAETEVAELEVSSQR